MTRHSYINLYSINVFLLPLLSHAGMKGGVLEVLLVSAEDLKNAHLLGSSSHYVIIQCGNQTLTSKITTGKDRKVWWNEKFRFALSSSECKDLNKLKLTIVEKDSFLEDCCVGETTVHLTGVLREGSQIGFVDLEPASYNVVLYDGTYAGELKLGLKFISNVNSQQRREREGCSVPQKQPQSIFRAFLGMTLQRIPWSRFLFFQSCSVDRESRKDR